MKLPKYDVKKRGYEPVEEHNEIQNFQDDYGAYDYEGFDNTQVRPELMMTQFPPLAGNTIAPGLGNMLDMMKRTNHKI